MNELGLIVIWPNYLHCIDGAMHELEKNFKIVRSYDINWNKDILYQNFYRFYGDRLSTKSVKEKSFGKTEFRLIVFQDSKPKYDFRTTARGIEKVNVNFFDLKKTFRRKFGTRFGIHGSNDEAEASRDLSLLLGINAEDYKKQNFEKWSGKVLKIKRDITGSNGWNSLEQYFYFINSVEPYLVLRNHCELAKKIEEIDDIDFLVINPYKFSLFSNAVKMSKGLERANYSILVENKRLHIDLRYIGDDYFDRFWQKECMNKKVMHDNGFYIMDDENQYFSLLYHVLIHKRKMPKKYKKIYQLNNEELKNELYDFMYKKGYLMVEPN
ncbi:uncharacterized protein METZ01_LOCUS203947, partial [marine metagenome]